ncbi:hypothetical protein MSSAC_4322 [Methanosarcina siciliae C2J]|uniref:Uncharacterized protein n=1 Tax=Methanosarcina siciliae C2J TaxID=1434118 RepID=A0A0E3PTS9_9EURY|nr:DUF1673 family protein [Methanosarcina siciliae]AKB38912.1 hypothetical protein MSSAC_4322 [Methanosarcina siciliae C2J]
MNWEVEYIKKLMGWCPNAKASEIRSQISPTNFEANDRSGGEKGDRPGREKTPIKRNSKQFLFSFFVSICIIIAGIASTIMESLMNFVFVLMGFGLLLDTLSKSETNAKLSKTMSICSTILSSAMCLGLYFYFKSSGSLATAKLFALFGIFIAILAIYSTISTVRKKAYEEAF